VLVAFDGIDRSIDRYKNRRQQTKPEHTNNQTIDLYHTMAPRDKELKRLKQKTRRDNERDEKNQMIEKVEKAKESHRKACNKYNAKQRQRAGELAPAPMQSPEAWRRNLQPAFHDNGDREAYVQSLLRQDQADQRFTSFAQDSMTRLAQVTQDSMTRLAQVNGDASVREDDFRTLLTNGTDLQPAFHDHQ
jgi:hypothetical protein